MRNPTERSPSSSSRPSTSSIRARESASRSSANDEDSVIRRGLDLQDVGEQVADQLEYLLALERTLFDVGLCGHGVSCVGCGLLCESYARYPQVSGTVGRQAMSPRPGPVTWQRCYRTKPITERKFGGQPGEMAARLRSSHRR